MEILLKDGARPRRNNLGLRRTGEHNGSQKRTMEATFDYKSAKWKRVRAAALRRDKYQCVECRKYGRITPALHVHHIRHVEDDPSGWYDLDNLESLCLACHNKEHPEKGRKGLSSWRAATVIPPGKS